jgi:septal ring factor EnvC (AmiA/AmiB activator)
MAVGDDVYTAEQAHQGRVETLRQIKQQIDSTLVEIARAKARLSVTTAEAQDSPGPGFPGASQTKEQVQAQIDLAEQRLKELRAEESAVQGLVDEAKKAAAKKTNADA